MIALLLDRKCDFVTRLHQRRKTDFSRAQRLGKGDHWVVWKRPEKPTWMDQATYEQMPLTLTLRQVEVQVDQPGFRTESLVVVTTLLNANLDLPVGLPSDPQDDAPSGPAKRTFTATVELRDRGPNAGGFLDHFAHRQRNVCRRCGDRTTGSSRPTADRRSSQPCRTSRCKAASQTSSPAHQPPDGGPGRIAAWRAGA